MIDSVGQSGGMGAEINYRLLHSQGGMGSSPALHDLGVTRLLAIAFPAVAVIRR
ncbi:MAG: hypothetical protein L7S70_11795 [Pseudomonadales bacterium]|nr:hypothetical protein [Pseudomonadales bacterium]